MVDLLALGHAFTLSLGMGAMMTYGSYLSDKDDIVNASYLVAFLDTVIAIFAGVAIFTVVFSSGYDPDWTRSSVSFTTTIIIKLSWRVYICILILLLYLSLQ